MKKILAIISILAIILTFVACGNNKAEDKEKKTETMTVNVSDMEGNMATVADSDGKVYRITDFMGVEFKVDDKLVIEYDGIVLETYPLQFHEIYSIKKQ